MRRARPIIKKVAIAECIKFPHERLETASISANEHRRYNPRQFRTKLYLERDAVKNNAAGAGRRFVDEA